MIPQGLGDNFLALVQPLVGKNLETRGPNDGPMLDKIRHSVSPWFDNNAKGVAWCGMGIFWLFRELTGYSRSTLVRALGYDDRTFAPEAAESWHDQALRCPRPDGAVIVAIPEAYDLFLWFKRLPDGTYDQSNVTHVGLVLSSGAIQPATRYPTFEGNTCPEAMGDGHLSRNGNCFAFRSRPYAPAGTRFVRTPNVIKECF